jgi:hypothetical protein
LAIDAFRIGHVRYRPEEDVGFKISWIAFADTGKSGALQAVGLHDTGEPDEFNETPFSGAEFPGGWFVLVANDFGFVSPQRLAQVSVDCRVVAGQVHEGIMVSAAYGYERGSRVWELVHNRQQGTDDLSVSGSPPPSFQSIRQRLTQEHAAKRGGSVDYIFGIPVEVAAAVCGYWHYRPTYEWGMPQFTRLEVR